MNGKLYATMSGIAQVLIFVILNSVIYQILALMFKDTSVPYNLLAILANLICVPLLLRWRKKIRRNGIVAPGKRGTALWMLLALIIGPLLNNLIYLSGIMDYSSGYQSAKEGFSSGAAIWLFLNTVLLTPFVEEVLYRGILYEKIREKYRTVGGILISALVFGIVHANVPQFLYATVLGIVLAIVYREGLLVWSYVTHALVNLIAFARYFEPFASWESERTHVLYEVGPLLAGFVVVLVLLMNRRRKSKRTFAKVKY
ncbi:MAG: CPBP family intramembrane metalloprotease [Eubacterium sp.]|nr:CPBP family intramembrane metalloprotease [Eubacterium sp.]